MFALAGSRKQHMPRFALLGQSNNFYKNITAKRENRMKRRVRGAKKKELNRNRAQNSTTNGDYANVPTVK